MTTDITKLAQSLKAAAKNGCCHTIFPNDCLALVEALEKAQQRITQLESRTVKLPDDEDGQAYGFGKWSNGKLPATAGTMTISYCEDAWRAAFEVFSSAAGIKVEAE